MLIPTSFIRAACLIVPMLLMAWQAANAEDVPAERARHAVLADDWFTRSSFFRADRLNDSTLSITPVIVVSYSMLCGRCVLLSVLADGGTAVESTTFTSGVTDKRGTVRLDQQSHRVGE